MGENLKTITVCAECKRASCWQGIFLCESSDIADTEELTVAELKKLDLEHSDYWEAE